MFVFVTNTLIETITKDTTSNVTNVMLTVLLKFVHVYRLLLLIILMIYYVNLSFCQLFNL